LLQSRFANTLEETDDIHRRKKEIYKLDKQKLLEEGWTVVKKAHKTKKIGPGVYVQERNGQKQKGIVIAGENRLWTIHFEGNQDPIRNVSSLHVKIINSDAETYVWKLVADSDPEESQVVTEYQKIGLLDFDFSAFEKENLEKEDDYKHPFLNLLIKTWFGDWRQQLAQLNDEIENKVNPTRNKKRKMRIVSEHEWWKFIGILIGAASIGKGGSNLWQKPDRRSQRSFSDPINLGLDGQNILSHDCFKSIRAVFPFAFYDHSNKNDPWHPISGMVDAFNRNRHSLMASSAIIVSDEMMSAFRPRTTERSILPHLSFILRKPEPFGIELKATCCSVAGVLLFLEIQRGKEAMGEAKYSHEIGGTAACTARLVEESQYCGAKLRARKDAKQTNKTLKFYHDAWFTSVRQMTYIKSMTKDSEGNPNGHEFVGALKSNHSCFPKVELENKMKDYPSGSYLVMESKSPNGCKLVAIGYKYNARKVLCFLCTKNAGSTRPGKPYECRYPDKYGNTKVRRVVRPALISKYFEVSDIIDSNNHARQYLLRLEKLWKTKNPWFRFNTTMLGISVTDNWRLVQHHVSQSFDKMTVKDYVNRLAWDCIHNKFPTSTNSGRAFIQGDVDSEEEQDVDISSPTTGGNFSSQLVRVLQNLQNLNIQGNMDSTSSVSPLSSDGASSFTSTSLQHKLEPNPEKTNDGRPKRRRCSVCGNGNAQRICIHQTCKARVRTIGTKTYSGSFFCRNCGDNHMIEMN